MDNSKERQDYRNWFSSTFNKDEIEFLSSIGVECGADHKFFKFEILDIFDHLRNYKLKNNSILYDKVVDRYIDLVPKFLRSQIDRSLLKEDQYYAAWFFNRHCFFEKINRAKKEAEKLTDYGWEYLLWSPITDTNCPEECKAFNNKIYHVSDEKFIEVAVDHWIAIRRGCRCALIALTESNVKKKILKNQCFLSINLKVKFANEIKEAQKNIKNFNQVAYDLVFGKFPYYHLYSPENSISDDEDDWHIKDLCLRELQIIVESIDIVQNTHYIDTAQSRLNLARNKLDAITELGRVFDKTVFDAITAKLIIEFRKAHTFVYTNLFNAHFEKSKKVKRPATKVKYLNLAREAIEIGLTDCFADKSTLLEILNSLDCEN